MVIYGPYKRVDGRKHIIRIENGNHRTQSYPRFLMEEHLGRELEKDEHVDHINGDFTDDRLENLQLLSPADNNRKSIKPAETISFICPVCNKEAVKPARQIRANQGVQKKAGPYCSRSCAGKMHH